MSFLLAIICQISGAAGGREREREKEKKNITKSYDLSPAKNAQRLSFLYSKITL